MRKISNEFYQRELTIKSALVIFLRQHQNLKKNGSFFFKLQSIPILDIHSNRRQETVSVFQGSLQASSLFLEFNLKLEPGNLKDMLNLFSF